MFNFSRKANAVKIAKRYQVRYNEYNQIQVCEIDPQTGLGMILAGLFGNVGQYNRWLRENNVAQSQIVWGNVSENAEIENSRKYAM